MEVNYVRKPLLESVPLIVLPDIEHTFLTHTLPSKEIVEDHLHPGVDEYIIFNKGRFELRVDCRKQIVEAPGEGTSWVHISPGYLHGITAISDMSYVVIRTGPTKTILMNDLMQKKDTSRPDEDPCGLRRQLYDDPPTTSIAHFEITGTAREHKHPELQEVYHILSGSGQLFIERQPLEISPGDTIPIPGQHFHFLQKSSKEPLEVLVITHPGFNEKYMIYRDEQKK